jgi:hypothetical protein
VTFADDIAAALPELRDAAESRMTDTCRITVPDTTADPVWDPETGTYTQPDVTIYGPEIEPHEGKCRIKAPVLVNPFQSGGGIETWQVEESVLSIPADAPAIDSSATVTYLTAANNPNLPGRVFGVVGPHHESAATAQRILIREVVGTGGG